MKFWLALILVASSLAQAAPKGKVLVVLSSEDKITLQGGKKHSTGFYLPELMGPAMKLVDAGYTLVFANPKGNKPSLDKSSDDSTWFEKNEAEYKKHRDLCEKLEVCGPPGTTVAPKAAMKLSEAKKNLDEYAAVFVPGGHAPMEDLWRSAELGAILKHFHEKKKPTALICHAPIALLSALDNPAAYTRALHLDDRKLMNKATKNWIYKDYALTVFTTREEMQQEPGQDDRLGGFVRFYPDEALEKAGADVSRAKKWRSNVVIHEELITGQNPGSHGDFAAALLKALQTSDAT